MMENFVTLGTLLRTTRLAKELKQSDVLAKMRTKISSSYYSNIEMQGMIPGREILKDIANVLGIELERIDEAIRHTKKPTKFYPYNAPLAQQVIPKVEKKDPGFASSSAGLIRKDIRPMDFATYVANRNLLLKNIDIVQKSLDDRSQQSLMLVYDLYNSGTAHEPDGDHDIAMSNFLKLFDEKQKKQEREKQLASERERMTELLAPLIEKLSKKHIDDLLVNMGNRFKELENKHKDLEDMFYDSFVKKG